MVDNRGHSANNIKSWWTVEKYDTGASAWVSVNAIPAPSLEMVNDNRMGTAQIVTMADGSHGRIIPGTRWNYEPVYMVFHKATTSSNMITELNTYMNDNTGIRLTTHTGDKFEGYIENVNKIWNYRPGSQEFTVEVLLQPFDVDGSGTVND